MWAVGRDLMAANSVKGRVRFKTFLSLVVTKFVSSLTNMLKKSEHSFFVKYFKAPNWWVEQGFPKICDALAYQSFITTNTELKQVAAPEIANITLWHRCRKLVMMKINITLLDFCHLYAWLNAMCLIACSWLSAGRFLKHLVNIPPPKKKKEEKSNS